MDSFEFRCILTNIDSELSGKDIENLVFLCTSKIPASQQQTLNMNPSQNGLKLFEILERQNLLTFEDFKILGDLLKIIGRIDLYERLPPSPHSNEKDAINRYVDPFDRILFEISEELLDEEVEKIR